MMLADLSGADLVNVAHTVPGVQTKMLVKPEIKGPEDLRGKRIATSSLGSLGDFLFKISLRKNGVDPNREIIWLSIGTPPERLQALISGRGGCDRGFLSLRSARRSAKGSEFYSTRGRKWSIRRCR